MENLARVTHKLANFLQDCILTFSVLVLFGIFFLLLNSGIAVHAADETVDLPPNEDIPFTKSMVKQKYEREIADVSLKSEKEVYPFVADESVRVNYLLKLPYGGRFERDSLKFNLAPFELISYQIGNRSSSIEERGMEQIPITFNIRLSSPNEYGNYRLAPLELKLQFDYFAAADEAAESKAIKAQSIVLQKVPFYLEVSQSKEAVLLGESVSISFEIHADQNVKLLNEYPTTADQQNISFLSEFKPPFPFSLLGRARQPYLSDSHRLIRWQYDIALHDLEVEEFALQLPPAIWQYNGPEKDTIGAKRKGEATASDFSLDETAFTKGVRVTQPDLVKMKIIPMASADSLLRPMKGPLEIPADEKRMLLQLPLIVLAVLLVAIGICLIGYFIQLTKQRKEKKLQPVVTGEDSSQPQFDWQYTKNQLPQQLAEARNEYQNNKDQKKCTVLRNALVLQIGARLIDNGVFTVEEILAMTASEINTHAEDSEMLEELRELDQALAKNEY